MSLAQHRRLLSCPELGWGGAFPSACPCCIEFYPSSAILFLSTFAMASPPYTDPSAHYTTDGLLEKRDPSCITAKNTEPRGSGVVLFGSGEA